MMSEKTGGEVMADAYAAFDKWKDDFCEKDTTGFTEQLDLLDFINIYDIFNRGATTSRAEVLALIDSEIADWNAGKVWQDYYMGGIKALTLLRALIAADQPKEGDK